jgi:hypothetical protein
VHRSNLRLLAAISVSTTFVSDLARYDPEESHRFLFLLTLHKIALFGPNNAAFTAFGEVLDLFDNVQILDLLSDHAVLGAFPASAVMAAGCVELNTLFGGKVGVNYDLATGLVTVNGATVVEPDITGVGGIMHGVDSVLGEFTPCPVVAIPPPSSILDSALATGNYNTLYGAIIDTPGVLDAITAKMPVSESFAC